MAWWHARFLFYGDDLVGVDHDRLVPEDIADGQAPPEWPRLTGVQVSGYVLYGDVRGYYALAVAELAVDLQTSRVVPVGADAGLDQASKGAGGRSAGQSLTPRQKQIVREWLQGYNPIAWETSLHNFKRMLE